ncbi:hypothetical protein [Parablautia muri]|uniref:Uncharacterized protein n=1 Tax=Parablautia muri TaxID=2320879 RepID=A0A9X5GR37_9FIRM|nr:hypothetical protein [Parablautia muri]NBJ91929.1 hypothetical protein [Parablautia muri]
MQLPTMVKQIGKIKGDERVYLEDYVCTYLNELKMGKEVFPLRVALFGHVCRKENRKFYLIFGAASVIDELEYGRNEEQVRKEYFKEYELIGYVNIYGNKQKLPSSKEGYYIFYDKNEAMQNYLIFCYEKNGKHEETKADKEKTTEKLIHMHRKHSFFSIRDMIKRLIYGSCIIILAIAVSAISDYNKMYGFVEMTGRAVALVENVKDHA